MSEDPTRSRSGFDELARGLVNGSLSRRRALKLFAATALSSLVPARFAAAVVTTTTTAEPTTTTTTTAEPTTTTSTTTTKAPRANKVTICHKGKTITVGAPAVDAHLRHGDTLGPCPT